MGANKTSQFYSKMVLPFGTRFLELHTFCITSIYLHYVITYNNQHLLIFSALFNQSTNEQALPYVLRVPPQEQHPTFKIAPRTHETEA